MSANSKQSKQKNRRWSFVITADQQSFQLPVLCYGNSNKADNVKDRIYVDYKDNVESLKDKTFTVEKIPHETISITTQQQLDGMELENKILTRSLEMVYDDLLIAKGGVGDLSISNEEEDAKRKAIGSYVVKAKAELLKEYYPDGAGAAIENAIDKQVAELAEMGYKLEDEVANGSASE